MIFLGFYGFLRFLCFIVFRLFFKLEVVGLNNLNKELGGLVLVSNHKSYLDPVVLGLYLNRRLFFMAKSELFSVPVLGYIIKKLGAFPVKRGLHDVSALENARKIVTSSRILALFPEGTRSKNGEILKFKLGAVKIALHGNCKILPCSIFYSKSRKFFRRRIFLEYGEAVSLNQLNRSQNFNFSSVSHSDLISMTNNLRDLIVKMNINQKCLDKRVRGS